MLSDRHGQSGHEIYPGGLDSSSRPGQPVSKSALQGKAAIAKVLMSMIRLGMLYDNALIESFFANLKIEINESRSFENREVATIAMF